jgi:osmotically-inducible protein OsmY
MKIATTIICSSILLVLTAFGCASNVGRTHRGDLLDDKVTTERVSAALSRAGDDFKNVKVESRDGVVILSGSTKSPEIRSRAEEIARSTHRVTSLEDRLQIQK